MDQFYTHGFDLNFNCRVFPWLNLTVGTGVTGRKQFIEGTDIDSDYLYTTDIMTQINYLWKLPDLNFSLFYKFNGAYPDILLTGDSSSVIVITDGYNSLDFNISRWFWKRRINVQMGGKNLFDVTNIERNVDSEPAGSVPINWGRTFFVKVQFSFNK